MPFILPPITINRQGEPRRAGFEFEYTGLGLEQSARIIARHFGGTPCEETLNCYRVDCPGAGSFEIKLDMLWMQKLSEEAARQRAIGDEDTLETIGEKLLTPIVSTIMPYEIITPPLQMEMIPALDALCTDLSQAGAKGTEASPLYAFGMHINPEMPAIAPEELRRYLGAFFLLQGWLKEETQMDFTRRIAPYAKFFKKEYGELILQPDSKPDLPKLIDDYLTHNPTRNRALDMLPLFTFLDEKRVRRVVKDKHVKPRPAFHYRLPNCNLDKPGWSVIREWNLWVQVERLAEDPVRLRAMSDAWLKTISSHAGWMKEARRWMQKEEGRLEAAF